MPDAPAAPADRGLPVPSASDSVRLIPFIKRSDSRPDFHRLLNAVAVALAQVEEPDVLDMKRTL